MEIQVDTCGKASVRGFGEESRERSKPVEKSTISLQKKGEI